MQNPYEYGYQSIRLLHALATGKSGDVPSGGVLDIPARTITTANLEEFRAELARQMAVLKDG